MLARYSLMTMCSSNVWSSFESPGPFVTMGRFLALPRMFMSPVPVLCRSVAGLVSTFLTDDDSTWTSGEALLTSNGSTVSRTVAFTSTFGLAAWYFVITFSICPKTWTVENCIGTRTSRFISASKGTTEVALPPTTLTKQAETALYGLAEGSSDGYEEAFLICSQSSYAFSKALSYSQGVEACPVSVLQTILSWICPLYPMVMFSTPLGSPKIA